MNKMREEEDNLVIENANVDKPTEGMRPERRMKKKKVESNE